MIQVRVEFVGGPLDGAVQHHEVPNGQFIPTYFVGPDPSQDRFRTHVVVYELAPEAPDLIERKRKFNREMTDIENLKRGGTL